MWNLYLLIFKFLGFQSILGRWYVIRKNYQQFYFILSRSNYHKCFVDMLYIQICVKSHLYYFGSCHDFIWAFDKCVHNHIHIYFWIGKCGYMKYKTFPTFEWKLRLQLMWRIDLIKGYSMFLLLLTLWKMNLEDNKAE